MWACEPGTPPTRVNLYAIDVTDAVLETIEVSLPLLEAMLIRLGLPTGLLLKNSTVTRFNLVNA